MHIFLFNIVLVFPFFRQTPSNLYVSSEIPQYVRNALKTVFSCVFEPTATPHQPSIHPPQPALHLPSKESIKPQTPHTPSPARPLPNSHTAKHLCRPNTIKGHRHVKCFAPHNLSLLFFLISSFLSFPQKK